MPIRNRYTDRAPVKGWHLLIRTFFRCHPKWVPEPLENVPPIDVLVRVSFYAYERTHFEMPFR
jgi:hypothetical protein